MADLFVNKRKMAVVVYRLYPMLKSLPSFIQSLILIEKIMVKWFCCSALCFNNYKSRDSNGETLKYYRLPREERIQAEYCKIIQISVVNWGKKVTYVQLIGVLGSGKNAQRFTRYCSSF